MPEPSLLCVHAHPDDEAIWTGGTLARYASAGVRTGVVTCTWAEGTRRAAELERSLEILGAGKPRLLGYADSVPESGAPGKGLFRTAPLDESVGDLVRHIREFRPDVVITYDAFGSYGHPDHIQAHRVTLAAVEAAAYEQLHPEAGDPWRVHSLYLSTLPRPMVEQHWHDIFGSPPGPDVVLPGVPLDRISTHLDVRPWAAKKWEAMEAHESEAERGAGPAMFTRLPAELRDDLFATEWYIRFNTPPTAQPATDLFTP
jgi:N-acetyl-1-D-myo-inositol-2-amino-2-deoxy-alpha-D-glucopyranoside deacetylase